jgi:hypothetical protein
MTKPIPKKKDKKKSETWAEFFKRMALPIGGKAPVGNANTRKLLKKVDK